MGERPSRHLLWGAALLLPAWLMADAVSLPHSFVSGGVASATEVNANFAELARVVNINAANAPKMNKNATTDPGADDDATPGGYQPGSLWINTEEASVFSCVDATDGAAVWVKIGQWTDPYLDYLELHLDFEAGGADIIDRSSNNHSVVRIGGAAKSSAEANGGSQSLYLDGVDDWIRIAHHTSLDFGSGDFSVRFAYKAQSTMATEDGLVHKGSYGTTSGWWIWKRNNPHRVHLGTLEGLNDAYAGAIDDTPEDGSWHDILATRSGDTFSLYVDGVFQSSDTRSGTVATSGDVGVGCYNWVSGICDGGSNDGFANGWIDDLKFYKGVAITP